MFISLFVCMLAILFRFEFSWKKRVVNIFWKELEIKIEDFKLANKILVDKVDKLNVFKYMVSYDLKIFIFFVFNFLFFIKMEIGNLINSFIL